MGSSLGGVVSFYLAWQYPEVFGKRGVPVEHVRLQATTCSSASLREPRRELALYLDSGWPEDNYEVTLAMAMARCRGAGSTA